MSVDPGNAPRLGFGETFDVQHGFDPTTPWWCGVCREFYSANHWLTGACRTPAAWFERFVLGPHGLGDGRHMSPGVTTTAFSATCPRRARLRQLRAGPQVADRKVAASVGTGMHEILAHANVAGLTVEGRSDTVVSGIIDGIEVSGKIDAIFRRADGLAEFIDYKVRNPMSEKHEEGKLDDAIQAGINMELARQDGWRPEEIAGTWVMPCYFYHWGEPLWVPGAMTIDEVLAMVPSAGGPTVRECLRLAAAAQECVTVADVLARIPAIGESMYEDKNRTTGARVPGTGKMCRRYCELDPVCHPERYRGI